MLAQIFHPFPESAKSDGMRFGLLAQTIHQLSALVKFDGMKFSLLAQAIHPIPASAKSDVDFRQKRPNRLHPFLFSPVLDGQIK